MHTDPATTAAADSSEDSVVGNYRSVSITAVTGLLLGVLSVAALLGPAFWLLPVAGILVSLRAMRIIGTADSVLVGRKLALTGLFLSAVCGAAGPADWLGTRWYLERSAQPFVDAWFAALAHGEPQKALQLKAMPGHRRPLDDTLWQYYSSNDKARSELLNFVKDPTVKTLLLLGDQARVRLYETVAVQTDEQRDMVFQVYAVTFEEQGQRTTFFVNVGLERALDFSHQARWRLTTANGGVRPQSWQQ